MMRAALSFTHTHTPTNQVSSYVFRQRQALTPSLLFYQKRFSSLSFLAATCKTKFMTCHHFFFFLNFLLTAHTESSDPQPPTTTPAILAASQNTWWRKWHEENAAQFVSNRYRAAQQMLPERCWLWAFLCRASDLFLKGKKKKKKTEKQNQGVYFFPFGKPLNAPPPLSLVWLDFISSPGITFQPAVLLFVEKKGGERNEERREGPHRWR